MSSQARNPRGDANRLDLRTLVIASIASAVAAIVVSRFWTSGTPIAAAATPVFVTLFKEMLDRPSSRIAERLTSETRALPETEVRDPVVVREPVAARGGREPAARESGPTRRTAPPDRPARPPAHSGANGHDPGDIRVYRGRPAGGIAKRIHPRVVLITGLLAFLIAGLVITAGQVVAGDHGNGAIILGKHKAGSNSSTSEQQGTTPDQQQTAPQEQQQNTTTDQQNGGTPTTPSDQSKPQDQPTPQQTPRSQQQQQPAPSASPPASP